MGFNAFPGFPRKKPIPDSVGETYPKTGALREHKKVISAHVERSKERFDRNLKKELQSMFESDSGLKYVKNIEPSLLTEAEIADLKNFIGHATKRAASGAVASDAFHKQVWEGKPGRALEAWAPVQRVGHDSMHSLLAYSQTNGRSLVPAYMKLATERDADTFTDDAANLEESYVNAFANLQALRNLLTKVRTERGVEGEELVEAVAAKWEKDNPYEFPYSDPDYPAKNRWPEFVNIIRNLSEDMQSEVPDPNFPVHEFQRIAEPLLARLRTEEPAQTQPEKDEGDLATVKERLGIIGTRSTAASGESVE